jgi:hypothetical protein
MHAHARMHIHTHTRTHAHTPTPQLTHVGVLNESSRATGARSVHVLSDTFVRDEVDKNTHTHTTPPHTPTTPQLTNVRVLYEPSRATGARSVHVLGDTFVGDEVDEGHLVDLQHTLGVDAHVARAVRHHLVVPVPRDVRGGNSAHTTVQHGRVVKVDGQVFRLHVKRLGQICVTTATV